MATDSGSKKFGGGRYAPGPQGFQGDPGSPGGPQGFQGYQGESGPAGTQGSQGYQGLRGNTGFQGSNGSGYGVNTVTASTVVNYARVNDATFDAVDSMSVTVNTSNNAALLAMFTATIQGVNSNNYHALFRFLLDGTMTSPTMVGIRRDSPPLSGEYNTANFHFAYVGLSSGTHTLKVQVSNDGTSQDIQITDRRLTATWSG